MAQNSSVPRKERQADPGRSANRVRQVSISKDQPPVPAPASGAVTANAQTVRAQTYRVQNGDTLRGIGNRTGAGSEIIARANGLQPPYTLRTGQKLVIPGGRYHLVGAGQSGLAIAQAYKVPWSQIVAENGLAEPFVLRNGQRLKLPTPAERPLTPEERAATFHIDIDSAVSGSAPTKAEAKAERAPPVPAPPPVARTPKMASTNGFAWPATGKIVSAYGRGANGTRNNGIDISVPAGTPVLASSDGVVSFASDRVSVFGGLVLIDHKDKWRTAYGYISRVDVRTGQKVKQGQVIGLTGDSGLGSRPKLHFELRQDRTPVDPLSRLPKRSAKR